MRLFSRWNHLTYEVVNLEREYPEPEDIRETSSAFDANVLSSEISDLELRGHHTVMLDLDVPATLIPSSTPGHSHLYIDVPMPWRHYENLLRALALAGVIEDGYADASIRRGHTSLRLPWVRKEQPAEEPF